MSAVIDPITFGVVFRMDAKPPPESASSGPTGGSASDKAAHR